MKLGRTGSLARSARRMDERVLLLAGKVSTRRSRGEGRAKYGVAKDRLSSAPFVSMVQAAHLSNDNDTTVLRSVYASRHRGVSFAKAKCVRDFS